MYRLEQVLVGQQLEDITRAVGAHQQRDFPRPRPGLPENGDGSALHTEGAARFDRDLDFEFGEEGAARPRRDVQAMRSGGPGVKPEPYRLRIPVRRHEDHLLQAVARGQALRSLDDDGHRLAAAGHLQAVQPGGLPRPARGVAGDLHDEADVGVQRCV